MKFCPRLLIFEPLDCTLEIFRGYDFSIFKYCYFWIDILGFLIQTFEPAPPPRMFSYGVPPGQLLFIFLDMKSKPNAYSGKFCNVNNEINVKNSRN